MLNIFRADAQYTIMVGHPCSGSPLYQPYHNENDYNWCTVIYPQELINIHGDITHIAYDFSVSFGVVSGYPAPDQKIYMGHITYDEFTDGSYPDTSAMKLVYNGDIDWYSMGWTTIALDSVFDYNNQDNLIIHYENHDGFKEPESDHYFSFNFDNSHTEELVKYNNQDGSFPYSSGTLDNVFPVIKLTFSPGLDVGVNSLINPVDSFLPGQREIAVSFRNYMADTVFSTGIEWEIDGIPQTTFNWSDTLLPGQQSESINLATYDFASGIYNMKFWTSSPNEGEDEDHDNDTLELVLNATDQISIGSGTSFTINAPFYPCKNYGWSAAIYTRNEISFPGTIKKLAYHVAQSTPGHLTKNQKIYIAHTTSNTFSGNTKPDVSSMQLVFDGDITWVGEGWHDIEPDTTFFYNNSDNLLIVYENRDGTLGSPCFGFRYTPSTNRVIHINQDGSFPGNTGTLDNSRPNIRLTYALENDAGVTSVDAPYYIFTKGLADIKVSLKNFGTDTLKNADIMWQIDADIPTTYHWTGTIYPWQTHTMIHVGSFNFSEGEYMIKVWSEIPNSNPDFNHENDTVEYTVKAGNPLSGDYCIHPDSANYPSFNAAIDSLVQYGICNNVRFFASSDTFEEQVVIPYITGVSSSKSITFQSLTEDSTDVILTYKPTSGSTNYIVKLDSAHYTAFKNITLLADDPTYARLIEITNGSSDNTIRNNRLIGITNQSELIYSAGGQESLGKENRIEKNLFLNGLSGISVTGNHTQGIDILSNIFKNQTEKAVYTVNLEAPVISGNLIQSNSTGTWFHGIYCHNCKKNTEITKNKISLPEAGQYSHGIHLLTSNGTANNRGLIANNFVHINGNNTTGIDATSDYQNVYHNNVNITGEEGNGYAVKVLGASNVFIKNNSFVNQSKGPAFYYQSISAVTCNHNNYFTNGDILGTGPEDFADLNAWQIYSSQDLNSISTNPAYFSCSDLHTFSYFLDNTGEALLEITEDIDGETRNAVTPDIGADEFTSCCPGILKGTYTVGPTGTFAGFNEAVNALFYCGIDSCVSFHIEPGTYNEQVLISGIIPGFTENDTITFMAANDDSTSVNLTYSADSTANYTLKLSGVNRFIFKSLTISAMDTTYGRVIEITGNAGNNIFLNNRFVGVPGNDESLKRTVIYSEENESLDTNNTFRNNLIEYGSYGIYFCGDDSPSNYETNLKIINNRFKDQSSCGICLFDQRYAFINNNEISNLLSNYAYQGVYLENCDNVCLDKNRISINNTNSNCCGLKTHISSEIGYSNNFVHINASGSGNHYGIRNPGNNSRICFNSFSITGNSPESTVADFSWEASGIDILNNIFSNMAGGKAICAFDYSGINTCDNNNIYTSGNYIGHWNGSNITNLPGWRTITTLDGNSVSADPGFVSDADLHTSNALLNKRAVGLPEIIDDIDGELRDPSTPDIGADEFFTPVFDLGSDDTICVDESFTIDPGYGFDSYLWSAGETTSSITVDSAGIGYGSQTYWLTVTNAGDQYTDSITITYSSPIATPVTDYCASIGDTIIISAGIGNDYLWSTGDTTREIIHIHSSESFYNVTVTDANGCSGSGMIIIHTNPVAAPVTDYCSSINDTITISAGIGTDYLWNTGDTTREIIHIHSSESFYNVTVTDAFGCSDSGMVKIHTNPVATPVTDYCASINDTITISASIGNDYLWNTGDTTREIMHIHSSDTSYNVTVTDVNRCSDSGMIKVHTNPVATPVTKYCASTGDTIIISAGTGTDYLWSTGDTTREIIHIHSSESFYNVTVTEPNGCSGSGMITIHTNPIATPVTDYCANNGDTMIISAGTGTDYLWSTGDTTREIIHVHPSQSSYIVTVTNVNGCSDEGVITIHTNPYPADLQLPEDTNIYCYDSIILTALTNPECMTCLYEWSTGENTFSITVDSSGVGLGSLSISVTVEHYYNNALCSSSDSVRINFILYEYVREFDNDLNIKVYPNPGNDNIYIENRNTENIYIEIININGQVIYTEEIDTDSIEQIDISGFQKGLYAIRVIRKDIKSVLKLIIYR